MLWTIAVILVILWLLGPGAQAVQAVARRNLRHGSMERRVM